DIPGRVDQGLALTDARSRRREGHHRATELPRRHFERAARPGRVFEEEIDDGLAAEKRNRLAARDRPGKCLGGGEKGSELLFAELRGADQMLRHWIAWNILSNRMRENQPEVSE